MTPPSGQEVDVSVVPAEAAITENRIKRADGQFAKGWAGGPGRPKGGHNKATLAGHRIKAEILEIWDRIDGPAMLERWAREHFEDFLQVVLQLVPRQDIVDVQPGDNGVGLKLVFNKAQEVLDSDDGDHFIDSLPDLDQGPSEPGPQ